MGELQASAKEMENWLDIILRLGLATAIGGAMGLNRDLHHKPIGLRTLGLVGLGSRTLRSGRLRWLCRRHSAPSKRLSTRASAIMTGTMPRQKRIHLRRQLRDQGARFGCKLVRWRQ